MEILKAAARHLANIEKDDNGEREQCIAKLAERIEILYTDARISYDVLKDLFNGQGALVYDLRQTSSTNVLDSHEESESSIGKIDDQTSQPEDLQPEEVTPEISEFSNQESDATKVGESEETVETRKDEVYLAVFKDEDTQTDTGDVNELVEGIGKTLYAGVMSQLKEALIPIKIQMSEREKKAVTSVIGEYLKNERNESKKRAVDTKTQTSNR